MDSIGGWSSAVDPDAPDVAAETRATAASRGDFTAGVFAGILVAAVAAQLWLAQHLEALALFVEGGVELRSLSRLAVSPLWRYGVPGCFAGVCLLLYALRVRATAVWATVAAAAILTLVLTHVWAFAALD